MGGRQNKVDPVQLQEVLVADAEVAKAIDVDGEPLPDASPLPSKTKARQIVGGGAKSPLLSRRKKDGPRSGLVLMCAATAQCGRPGFVELFASR